MIVVMDGDGSYPAEALPRIVSGLEHSHLVVGSRCAGDLRSPQRKTRRFQRWRTSCLPR